MPTKQALQAAPLDFESLHDHLGHMHRRGTFNRPSGTLTTDAALTELIEAVGRLATEVERLRDDK